MQDLFRIAIASLLPCFLVYVFWSMHKVTEDIKPLERSTFADLQDIRHQTEPRYPEQRRGPVLFGDK